MEPFEERLNEERKEVTERLIKLDKFLDTAVIGQDITQRHYKMLKTQYDIMLAYEQILLMRIDDLKDSKIDD